MKLHPRKNIKNAICVLCNKNKVRCKGRHKNGDFKYSKHCLKCDETLYPSKYSRRNRILQIKYGITLEDYNNMFTEQQGCCAICKEHQSNLNISLAVDHDHKTLKVRGLLCRKCNLLLGHVKDNIHLLKQSILYLENI